MDRYPNELCPVCKTIGPPPFRLPLLILWHLLHRLGGLPLDHA